MKIGKKFKYFSFAVLLGTLFTAKCDVVNAATWKTVADTLPDEVTGGTNWVSFKSGTDITNTASISNYPSLVSAVSGYQLYCSDRNRGDLVPGTTLVKGDRMKYGLAYILSNSYPTKSIVGPVTPKVFQNSSYSDPSTDPGDNINDMLDVWVTQMAIWGYQGSIASNGLENKGLGVFDNVNKIAYDYFYSYESSSKNNPYVAPTLWKDYVEPLITKAMAATVNSPYDATMTMKVDGEWAKIDGTNSVKSGLISTSISSGNTGTYSLTFDNAPQGTKVYTEDGKEVTDLKSIPVSSKIYLVVPKSDKKEDYKFSVNASSTLTYDAAYQYVDKTTGHQPSILVGPESKDLSASIEMTLAPDTALSVSNSIYFLGFLILISGVFVIYANVKTKEVSE